MDCRVTPWDVKGEVDYEKITKDNKKTINGKRINMGHIICYKINRGASFRSDSKQVYSKESWRIR